jgi:hypothetical protein
VASGRPENTCSQAKHRRLTRTVGTQQSNHVARIYPQRHLIYNRP